MMKKRNLSENFSKNHQISDRHKREMVSAGIRSDKRSLYPNPNSELNSPAGIRNFSIRRLSNSRRSFSRDVSPLSKLIRSEKNSPRNLRLKKIIKPSKQKNNSMNFLNIYLNASPSRNSPKFSLILQKKLKTCLTERSKSSTKVVKNSLEKEKEELIQMIIKHFTEDLYELTTSIKFYKILQLLGQGAFGKVILAVQVLTDIKVAIKVIDKSYLQNDHSRRKVFREIYILKKIHSIYVVKILEFFESDENMFIVMEYLPGGDLLNYLKKNGKIPEPLSKKLFFQILSGARIIHSHSILHRDFKLDNILLDRTQKSIKICDFGVSKLMNKGEVILDQCGTPAYLAPEIVLDKGYEGYWSDIWSLGVLLYCMVCGTVPFKANKLSELNKAILIGKYDFPEFLSVEVKDLIRKMLHSIPNKRITIDNALAHSWFDGFNIHFDTDINEKTLRIDESQIRVIESFGFPRQYAINTVEYRSLNHVYALYTCLINNDQKYK